jgi:serine/threonine-protein kinase
MPLLLVPLSLLEQLDGPDGTFRIEREIEGGGMSRVFVAIDRELERRIVVKVLPPELLTDLSLERFRREIRIAANLQHPNIVPVLSAGQTATLIYYTMPHVVGETLRQRLSSAAATGQPLLPLDEVVRILREVARALTYAHRHGIVHRDIKPENILLADDAVVVADFGVAKALSAARAGATAIAITETGGFVGTPAYMAPEQAAGDPAADHRADIYSFGVLAYEMLTGAPPFRGQTAHETLLAHASATPAPIDAVRGDVPPALSRAVMRCLAKTPAERPQRAIQLRDVLDSVGPGHGRRTGRMRRPLTIAMIGIVVLLAGTWATIAALPAESRWIAMLATRPPTLLRTNRYVVKPFTNMTGDPTLDLLGDEAADFIGDALQLRVAGIEVVDWRATQAGMAVVDRIPWFMRPFRSKERALAYESGAGMLITGRIYRDAELLRMHTEMTDVITHRKLQTIQDVTGHASDPRVLIRAAQARIVGAVGLLSDASVTNPPGAYSDPPSLEGYARMRDGMRAYFRGDDSMYEHFHAAERVDPTWVTPTLLVAYIDGWNERPDELARDLQRARELTERMTAAELAFFEYVQAMDAGDLSGMLRAASAFMTGVPGSSDAPLLVSSTALGLHDTATAAAALARADPDRGLNIVGAYYWLSRIGLEKQRGDAAAVLGVALETERRFPTWVQFRAYHVRQLIAGGSTPREIDEVIAGARLPQRDARTAQMVVAGHAATALLMSGRVGDAEQIAARWVPAAMAVRDDSMHWARDGVASLLVAASQWEPLAVLPDDRVARGGRAWVDRVSYAAVGKVHLGDTAGARRAEALLRAEPVPHLDFGRRELARARIAAHLGERERAVGLLRNSIERGVRLHLPWGVDFRADAFLAPLRGDSAFQAVASRP